MRWPSVFQGRGPRLTAMGIILAGVTLAAVHALVETLWEAPRSRGFVATEAHPLPVATSLASAEQPECSDLRRAYLDYTSAGGLQQREALDALELALLDWKAAARPVNERLVSDARALWRAGDSTAALEKFAAAFGCH